VTDHHGGHRAGWGVRGTQLVQQGALVLGQAGATTAAARSVRVGKWWNNIPLPTPAHPARTASNARGCLHAAAALVSEVRGLHAALGAMQERGEEELFNHVLGVNLQHLQVDRHVARLTSTAPQERSQ